MCFAIYTAAAVRITETAGAWVNHALQCLEGDCDRLYLSQLHLGLGLAALHIARADRPDPLGRCLDSGSILLYQAGS